MEPFLNEAELTRFILDVLERRTNETPETTLDIAKEIATTIANNPEWFTSY